MFSVSPGKLYQFYNCRILRNSKIYFDDLWIRDSKIVDPEKIFYDEKIIADERYDCQGKLITAGFIDLQINGGFGCDFSTITKENADESINIISKGILKHGVTSYCPTVITSSPENYSKIIPEITKRPGSENGAGILGLHVEGPFINKNKKGAHPIQHIKTFEGFSDVLKIYGSLDNVAIVTLAPELDPDGHIIKEFVKRGITVSLGHSNSTLTTGETAIAYGASFITHLFNAMLPFHHRDPGLVGLLTSKKLPDKKNVFYGIIADGIHTHPAALRIAFQSNKRGLVLVTDAMSAMGLIDGSYCIGEQKVEVSNEKAVVSGTCTLAGSIATMDSCVRFLLKSTGCTLVEALECATLHPAEVLGITENKGTLDFGTDADFVILDDKLYVHSTFINGKCVYKSEILKHM